jgi:SAM-dependent methyltransferase
MKDTLYATAGIGFLGLAKAKHALKGYSTPKPFSVDETDRCIDYDIRIAQNWLHHLAAYGGSAKGKDVLELGPGSDLGTGAYLLHRGARAYQAFDRHDLASRTPPEFWRRLAQRISVDHARLGFSAREDFDLSQAIPAQSVDLVVSNAAFEHFDDCASTVRQLSDVVRPGGVIVTVIDLQTHSRWIRERDPNNIYRYPEWLYRLFYFPGQPNRMRPADYVKCFEHAGWTNITITPDATFNHSGRVHRRFRNCPYLNTLSMVLCATRT